MQTVSISTLTSQKWAVVIDQCIQTRFHFLRSNVWHNNLENILDINTDIFYLRQKLVDMHAMISIAKTMANITWCPNVNAVQTTADLLFRFITTWSHSDV